MTSEERRSQAMKDSWARRKANPQYSTVKRGPYKKKGKWSAIARAKQSARMKERFASAKIHGSKSAVTISKVSINERLNIIEHHVNSIRQQLGG